MGGDTKYNSHMRKNSLVCKAMSQIEELRAFVTIVETGSLPKPLIAWALPFRQSAVGYVTLNYALVRHLSNVLHAGFTSMKPGKFFLNVASLS